MGGKVAMQLALRRPELLRALVVVDIAPVEYPVSGGRTDDPDEEASPFAAYIEAMQDLDLDQLQTRDDADAALKAAVPSRMVRSFLLQSLVREGLGTRRRLAVATEPRPARAATSASCAASPPRPPGASFDGPVLWIAGANSHYVLPEDRAAHGCAVPEHPAGADQERRPLGALRAAGDLPRDAAPLPGGRRALTSDSTSSMESVELAQRLCSAPSSVAPGMRSSAMRVDARLEERAGHLGELAGLPGSPPRARETPRFWDFFESL